jgi:hypothetical protein
MLISLPLHSVDFPQLLGAPHNALFSRSLAGSEFGTKSRFLTWYGVCSSGRNH